MSFNLSPCSVRTLSGRGGGGAFEMWEGDGGRWKGDEGRGERDVGRGGYGGNKWGVRGGGVRGGIRREEMGLGWDGGASGRGGAQFGVRWA